MLRGGRGIYVDEGVASPRWCETAHCSLKVSFVFSARSIAWRSPKVSLHVNDVDPNSRQGNSADKRLPFTLGAMPDDTTVQRNVAQRTAATTAFVKADASLRLRQALSHNHSKLSMAVLPLEERWSGNTPEFAMGRASRGCSQRTNSDGNTSVCGTSLVRCSSAHVRRDVAFVALFLVLKTGSWHARSWSSLGPPE